MKIISPIAIDMGAKNTGVYYAKYQEGAAFEQIEKQGQVLVYGNYTPLLKERTANRHARRGYQRKKLAKRLLTVILEEYFCFPAKEHSQAIGFLLNRRGFTRLEGEYSEDYLRKLPCSVWNELPGKVHDILGDRKNIVEEIEKFTKDQPEQITDLYKAIQEAEGYKKIKNAYRELVYYSYVDKIREICEKRISQERITEERNERHKLSRTSKWIVERLINDGAGSLREVISEENTLDLLSHMNNLNEQQAENLKNQLPDASEKQEQAKKEVKESIWAFSLANFDLDEKKEEVLDNEQHKHFQKTHLHHFCYAIHKINDEIVSGGRHRSKFFTEIEDDLKNFNSNDFIKNENNPEYLKNFVLAVRGSQNLDIDKLSRLAGHISNLELKPLRAYFNDKTPVKKGKEHQNDSNNFISHKGRNGDRFCNAKLSRIASTWFLKNWVVNAEKDGEDKVKSYQKLKNGWKDYGSKDDIVAFWLATDPILTIPPYQSMTNRRPPRCQSLVLNPKYLTEHYPSWKCWLSQLQPDENYRKKLQDLQSGKGNRGKYDGRLIDDDGIALRELQFILDTTKKRDPFKLNEIWSIHHRLQQIRNNSVSVNVQEEKEWQAKLETVKAASKFPESLKGDLKFDKADSFGHFINKYYQTRKRTKEGRYFIHQSRKNHWEDEGKLFTLCTHKPKQKKHQMLIDLAAILGVDDVDLKEKVGSEPEKIEEWFKDIEGMKKACNDAAKAQKKHRGRLRIKIGVAQKEVKTRGAGQIDDESKDLFDLDEKCKARANDLVGRLCTGIKEKEQQKKSEKFNNVFSFAQINNILFEERAGFSKTCPVCSTDNGLRMRETNSEGAQASRLPALSIRLIDGLVMRICDAVSRRIANTCWNNIKDDLAKGREVRIPLILEQNRFEFEPNLAKLKRKNKKLEDKRDKEYEDKEERIKKSARGICAYKGTPLGDNGEFDHIIPQASRYGTLNDEANLIYVSNPANQRKTDQEYYISRLHQNYKDKLFRDKSDEEIKESIYRELEGEDVKVGQVTEGDKFRFGKYLSFINLSDEQQKAFRHALFLDNEDPLKKKVIRALQNRNRAIVNGTQRYMAQCIADKLYKVAKADGKERKIEFDYFEYTAREDIPNSTFNLRKDLQIPKPEKQPLYSHLVDAQMAFLLATEDHKKDGSMGLDFGDSGTIWEAVDTETGEIFLHEKNKFYQLTRVGENKFTPVTLDRKKSTKGVRLHRSFHRSNFYAENYVPVFIGKIGNSIAVKAGFSWGNSVAVSMNRKNKALLLKILKFAKNKDLAAWAGGADRTLESLYDYVNRKIDHSGNEAFCISWDKTKIQQHLIAEFSNEAISKGVIWNDEVGFLRKLTYRTRKEKIGNPGNITGILEVEGNFEIQLFGNLDPVELPVKKEWQDLSKAWRTSGLDDNEFEYFLKRYFLSPENQKNTHQQVRKVFSLPIINTGGHFLQKRKSWNGTDIYQISADSDSRKDNNKFSRLVMMADGNLKEIINKPFVSGNTFKLQKPKVTACTDYINIDPTKWIAIDRDKDFPEMVERIEYCIDNTTRPQVKIDLADNLTEYHIDEILENSLTEARDRDGLKEKLLSDDAPKSLEYTASGFNKDIKQRLLKAMKE